MSKIFDELFGWLKIEINGTEYPLKFTLGSLIVLKKRGINFFDPSPDLDSQLRDPEGICQIIHAGLPAEMRDKISPDEIAEKITIDQLQGLSQNVQGAVQASMPEQNKENSRTPKKK